MFPNKIDIRMYLHKSDKLALIRILSGGHPLSAGSPTLTLLNVFVRYRGGWSKMQEPVEGLGRRG